MEKLFSPAIALMNRLGYTKKFILLWLTYLITITVVMYGLYGSLCQVSRSSQRELEGIALIKPISITVQLIQQHRQLPTGFLGSIEDLRSLRAAKSLETATAFSALKNQLPKRLLLAGDWTNIEAGWNRLQTDELNWTADESYSAHSRLIGQLLDFEISVADEYALTFDPDLDSSYLIDTIIFKLPLAIEQLAQIQAYGTSILTNKQLSEYQKTTLIGLTAQLNAMLKTQLVNLNKTGRLNFATQARLSETISASDKIIGLVIADIITGHFSTLSNDFIKLTTEAIDKHYALLYDILLPTARDLVNARIRHVDNQLRFTISSAFLLVLLAYYFFIGSYYAMKSNVQSLALAARAFASGNLHQRINLDTRDELRQVAESFNEMADSFQLLLAAHTEDEERFCAITDNAPMIIFIKDASGRYIYANLLFEETFHTDSATLMKKTDYELFSKVTADALFKDDQKVIQSGQCFEIEELVQHNDEIHTYIAVKFPLRRVSGEIYAVCGIATDITERKKAEQLLKNSETYLRAIFNATPDAMLINNERGIITMANQQAEHLLGYPVNGLLGLPVEALVPMSVRAGHPAQRAQFSASSITRPMGSGRQVKAQRKDGSVIDVEISLSPIKTEQGLFFASALRDTTERIQSETELRVSAAAFETHEAMTITDAQTVILRINRAFSDLTGYTANEVVGQKINLLKSGRHDTAFYTSMWESINLTGVWQGEIWDRRKNGEIYPKWLSITAVKDAAGVVTHYVGTHIDITGRKTAEEQIKQLAFYDPLTQLPNRRLLQERLKHGISQDSRSGRQLGLLMLDLDRFKAVNDSLGHLAGDELLQQVAARILARLREVDMVARLGGDEFIVLLEDIAQPEDAARVAEEIITDLSKPFCLTQSDNIQIGASIGISLYPQHGDSPETLMDHADAALYQAKDAGRGCFAYFSEDLTLAARERIALETRLRSAVEQNELRVFYQPQVDIVSGRIVGAEALVRWQDPMEGLIPPIQFIPIAEETSLILEIGAWVLRETCRQGRQWLDEGLPPLTLAVNVSPQQFRRGNICALAASVLSDTAFPPNQLELEITESGLMESQGKATAILNSLRTQGIRLAIDDFGTGYSSLAYLKHFPLDVLKIDKRFIDDIPFHQDDMEIAATIIAMSHILGFKVLAEGVETPEQLAFLQEKGCDLYQGYIKSKPVPAEQFAQLLAAQQRENNNL